MSLCFKTMLLVFLWAILLLMPACGEGVYQSSDDASRRSKKIEPTSEFTSLLNQSVSEGNSVSLTPHCNSSSGNSPSYRISADDSTVSCTISDQVITCSAGYKSGHENWSTTVNVICTIDEKQHSSTFTLSINDTNRAPTLASITNQSIRATQALSTINAFDASTLSDTDSDSDPLTYSCTFSGGGFAAGTNCSSLPSTSISFLSSSGVLDWTPSHSAYTGSSTTYSITITSSDGQSAALAATQSFTVTVNPAAPSLSGPSDQNYPSNSLGIGASYTYNFYNTNYGNDTGVSSYSCTFDRLPDDTVSSGTNCTSLPGTVSFNTSTGVFAWTPANPAYGAYEIKVIATNSTASTSDIFVISVKPEIVTTNLTSYWDAQFANRTGPYLTSNNSWKDLTSNANHGTNSDSTHASWAGSSDYSSPNRLAYDGSGKTDFGGTVLNSATKVMFDTWIFPTSPTTAGRVLISNRAEAAENGFLIKQDDKATGKLVALIGQTTYSAAILADSPYCYYRLGESSGAVATDSSGNGRNGTYTGTVSYSIAGAILDDGDTAISNNGSAAYVSTSIPAYDTNSNFTAEAWFKTSAATGAYYHIMSAQTSGGAKPFECGIWDDSKAYCTTDDGIDKANYTKSSAAVNDGNWHYIAISHASSGAFSTYLDGVLLGTRNDTGSTANADGVMIIGASVFDNMYYSGVLDEVAVYSSALSASQILNHYNAGKYRTTNYCRTGNALDASVWSHLAGLFDGTTFKLFLNGRESCSVNASGLDTPARNLVTGSAYDGTNGWSGSLSELRVYGTSDGSVVGTTSSIKTNFDVTADRYRETPVGNIVRNGLIFYLDIPNAKYGKQRWDPGDCGDWIFDLGTLGVTVNVFPPSGAICGGGGTHGWLGDGSAVSPYRLTLDGGGDYITFSDTGFPSGNSARSYQAWIKSSTSSLSYLFAYGTETATNAFVALLCGGGLCSGGAGMNGKFGISNSGAVVTSTTSINDGLWHNLAITYDGTDYKIYVDGSLEQTDTMVTNTVLSGGAISATTAGATTYPLSGSILNTMLYDRVLSGSEVSQNCNAQKSRMSGATCN